MNLITRFSIIGATFLTLAACSGQDYTEAARLPDDTDTEQALSNTESAESVADLQAPETEDSSLVDLKATSTESILQKYDHLDPQRLINTKALAEAVVYFENNKSRFKNQKYISLIDFGKRSTQARFFIVNLSSGDVMAIHTAHGKGSDSNHDGYAEKFSNKSGSNASSLGYYRAAETYYGKHGLSLKLDGLSSTNSNARSRAVVIHGASYVRESSVIQGRSWGCPAVANNLRDKVIGMLKGGSLIYAFAK